MECGAGLADLAYGCEHLDQLVLIRSDLARDAHQAHGPKQVALDHEAVEAPDALLQVDPAQDQIMTDR